MREKIQDIFEAFTIIEQDFINYQKRADLSEVEKRKNTLFEVCSWLNTIAQDEETKQDVNEIDVDIKQILQNNDYVLFHDVWTYGLKKYIQFLLTLSAEEMN